MDTAQLIALDWGSSSLRAYLMDGAGTVRQERSSDDGASRLSGGPAAFDAALMALAGDWLRAHPGVPVFACGMVGSAHGWLATPYVETPVSLGALRHHTVRVRCANGTHVRIVPGVLHRPAGAAPDVMRGEETQVAGVLAADPALADHACIVLPGTHSKWVAVQGGRIQAFSTRMTGELFAVLREHSVLGRLMDTAAAFDAEAFDRGLQSARDHAGCDLTGQLFSVRSLALTGELAPSAGADYLSGVLIGNEVAAAVSSLADSVPLVLAGDAALCARYLRALEAWGRAPARPVSPLAAAQGLWSIAQGGR